jgi:glycosidase
MENKYEKFLDLVIYQVYPRSFNDSNNDGIGDIPGLIEKLDYLCDLGINAIWICPCYKSPNHDNGYDISDYRDIMDEFGTLDDIKRLISEMNKRGMKLIMDLVPNHTSNEHKWFIESRKSKDNPYSDYYYWFDEPVNDWRACFGGSTWEYDDSRKQYYLHSYTVEQPDLNWDNPKVVKEMQDIVDYWVNLGVSGFRCDVIDQISKDIPGGHNAFGPHLHEYINALFGRKETENIFTVGECWANDIDEVRRHIAEDRKELSTLFQFEHMECGRVGKWIKKECTLKDLRDVLVKWQTLMQENNLLYSILTDNHDNSYLISRVGNDKELRYESATCIAAMSYLLRGVPFIYQGQEFGVTAPNYDDISYFDDIETTNYYEEALSKGMTKEEALENVNFGSRDNSRRPMMWDNSVNGGFSEAEPWIALHSRVNELNLENDLNSEKSVFAFYKALLKLRKEHPALRRGDFTVISKPNDNYFAYARTHGGEKFTVVCNFETVEKITVDGTDGTVVLSNYSDSDIANNNFKPYEIAVYKNN